MFQVTPQAIDEMKEQRDNIDWQKIRDEERRLKHDVMAHNHAFGAVSTLKEFLAVSLCFVLAGLRYVRRRPESSILARRLATSRTTLISSSFVTLFVISFIGKFVTSFFVIFVRVKLNI